MDVIFPNWCLHCEERITGPHPFCEPCAEHLSLLMKPERNTADCFAPIGPALLLPAALQRRPYLARGLAGFYLLRLDNLGWPTPDIVILPPQSLLERIHRGKGAGHILAHHLARLLGVPDKSHRKKAAFSGKTLLLVDLFADQTLLKLSLQEACPKEIYTLYGLKSELL